MPPLPPPPPMSCRHRCRECSPLMAPQQLARAISAGGDARPLPVCHGGEALHGPPWKGRTPRHVSAIAPSAGATPQQAAPAERQQRDAGTESS